MTQPSQHHNDTDQRLLLLVGLSVVAAAAAGAAALRTLLTGRSLGLPDTQITVALISLVIIGTATSIKIRIRSNTHGVQWVDLATMIGLAIAPASWVVLGTGLGVAVACVITKRAMIKAIFGIAKEMVLVASGGLTLGIFNWNWQEFHSFGALVGPIAAAYAVIIVLDELLTIPVIALASKTKVVDVFCANWDLRVAGGIGRFVLLIITLMTLKADTRLLVAVPPLVLSLHLAYSARVRARTEQQTWQRLAQATDALNVVDLDRVLATAVTRAAELFSADEVEVQIREPARLVRGDSSTIRYDGPPDTAPPAEGAVFTNALEGHGGAVDVGMLRLRFTGPVNLTERERYTLRTFASALCTAIRNASAYAELARAAREHAYAATHDPLTGLANRRQLLERGATQLARQGAAAATGLLLIDLDHFKEINDTLGHGAGDEVLSQVAHRLRAAAEPDDLVARLGGDEFAVLLIGLPAPAVAAHRADALMAALHEPLHVDGMRISVEASGGIAAAPNSGGMAELLRRADVAMYQAKRSGQRMSTYARSSDSADLGRLTLGGDLPRALADHEFVVDFQPIVDLAGGNVIAVEALARWHHPERGTIDPMRFLEAVERSDLLPAFAEAVLDQAITAGHGWREAGFDLPIAVNVSPRSLLDARFPGLVLARLRAHGLPADQLILELTETLTISQLEVVDRGLAQLRDEGVRLALDDFGTGYSSLSVLSRIPVHELKIDRSVVAAMDASSEASAVIRSTVDLGRSLDLVVIAEGVESEPQRRTLWELGCVAGQGHLFARPMPPAQLLATLRRGNGDRAGVLAPPLHAEGAVIRLPQSRRAPGRDRNGRLPHLPA